MDRLKGFISGCIQARKRTKRQRQYHHPSWLEPSSPPPSSWESISSCPHNTSTATSTSITRQEGGGGGGGCIQLGQLPQEPHQLLSKRSSIRIVPVTESESDDININTTDEFSCFDSKPTLSTPNFPYEDNSESETSTSDSGPGPSTISPSPNPDPSSSPNHSIPRRPLPDPKPRLIEDIPEEDETDDPEVTAPTRVSSEIQTQTQNLPTWRVSRRKSLVDILHLLQSTASTTAPKLSSIKLPIPHRSPLRKRPASTTSLPSLSSSLSTVPTTTRGEEEDVEESEEVQ
ncbi:hypothetical protein FE257_004482 [Aspergillus nanangensis]|uniref:Uncharacterized protein n=1 Tax=Aspergillus nanangensis TaxID=2582783 RepID=A0AAD4CYL3_ASPNN|nr:hypothetical protein FE257_004482 [Aspergillus nanangensis]